MPTLVDTNVLIDLFDTGSAWEEWSSRTIERMRSEGPIVINQIVYAEMAAGFRSEADLESALSPSRFTREYLPWEAAYAAGHAFVAYRRDGGPKRSPLPDFYIGAHAAIRGYRLLTRDTGRYRAYFPMLRIVCPDTCP